MTFPCDSLLLKSEALPCSRAKTQSQTSTWAVFLKRNKGTHHPVQGLSQKPEVPLDSPWQPRPRVRFNCSFWGEREWNSVLLIFCFVFLDFMGNDGINYFWISKGNLKTFEICLTIWGQTYYVSWGMERVIHQVPILSPTGKKAGTVCPVLCSCKEQLLSKPQQRLAGIWSELAHQGWLQFPGSRISVLVFRGLKDQALRNTFLTIWGETFGVVYSFSWGGTCPCTHVCILFSVFVVNCFADL